MDTPTRSQRRRKLLPEDMRHAVQLSGVLVELINQHGVVGAARELGIGYQTLRRSRKAARLSPALHAALVEYVRDGPLQIESSWWRRIEALEAQVKDITARLDEGDKRWRLDVEALEGQLARHDAPAQAEPAQTNETGGNSRVSASDELLARWTLAKAAKEKARTRLELARANEEVLLTEVELIQPHAMSVPPGESWDPVRRSREVGERWFAFQEARRERQRLERRRWLRRILTLGLWWP